ncbi:SusC/RagA family TonB-linked outer membrane protein [Niabella beijingensis]|uniref:SusC/RagA family TonB-linked outer membrane protein n=1 Tax=Niabella beijingensis TaxID=2872700 RepID=UPI001CBD51C4|nr:SusC/RagA family TonB-linked outer membrane protein [Niabella beijingensis]MBZ4189182.1 SusC/RagA family TonB-linked outer membrane protein [Niabella beijingensis]
MNHFLRRLIYAAFFLFPLLGAAQSVTVTGTVQELQSGAPLTGVTVEVSGTNRRTLTSDQGRFSIAAGPHAVLLFSYVGYANRQVNTDTVQGALVVQLESSSNALDEVVVTALGVTKAKKSLGYATQELKAKDISEAKETNIVNALAGKIAGVRITNTQGDMGSSRIVIRGETSIAGNNQPLFVVDGIPVDNSQLGAGGSRDFRNAISDLNPEDIETISVLKGPNAAALYGSRAAQGVVLIKTKTGRSKKGLGITLNSNVNVASLLILPEYQNVFGQGSEGKFSYVDGKGGGDNDGVDESWGPKLDGRLIPQFYSNGLPVPFVPHPDNVRDYFRTGVTYSNGIALANAGDNYDYRISYNNEKQLGVVPNSEAKKDNLSFNANYNVTSKLKIGVNANYILNNAPNLPGAGGKRATSTMLQFTWFGRQVDIDQLKNYKDANGNGINWNNSYYSNPYWIAYENTVSQRRNRLIGNINVNYTILDGLSANFRSGTDYYNDRRKLRVAYGTNGTPFGSYEEDAYGVNENNTEATLRYNKNISSDFSLDALGGWNVRTKIYEENIQQAPRLAVPDVYTLANSRDPLVSNNFYSRSKIYSAFASAQVGYKNIAFINLTARNDWSSSLPEQNLSYFYPSVNASLILSDALNIRSNTLNFLKLRGGWSKVGSSADPYQLINIFNFNAPFLGNPQLITSTVDLNPELKSETTNSAEAGLEAAFFNNRVRLDLNVYNTNSIDQILKVDVTAATGYNQKLMNAGKINNKGIEVQLGVIPVKNDNFQWNIDLNYAANRSRVLILDYEKRLQNYVLGSYRSVQVLASVGQPYGTLFGNAYLRDASGNIVVNNSGIPLADPNKKVLGKFTPDWVGGISNSVSYKNFSLSFLVDASIGGSLFAGTNSTGSYTGVLALTLPGRDAEHGGLNYYYPDNNKANGTRAGASGPNGETVYDDGMIFNGVTANGQKNTTIIPASQYYKASRSIEEEYVYDASYVKLREVKLGYNLPQQWIRKIGFQGASLSVVGRNLWIIHKKVPNIDPEVAFSTGNAQGLEDLTLPTVRNIGFNLNLKF